VKTFFVIILAAFGLSSPQAASAAEFIITYSGTVERGSDNGDIFGGGDLAGEDFVAQYRLRFPTQGATNILVGTDDNGYQIYRGSGSASPLINASVIINGQEFAPDIDFGSVFSDNNRFGRDVLTYGVEGGGGAFSTTFSDNTALLLSTRDITAPLNFQGLSLATSTFAVGDTNLVFRSRAVRVSGPVPEPATWMLLLFGFGAIGGAMRTVRAHRQRGSLAVA
jgi:hypothetical protein